MIHQIHTHIACLLIVVLMTASAQAVTAKTVTTQMHADLDGDGKMELIRLTLPTADQPQAVLHVSTTSLVLNVRDEQAGADGFLVVDVNTKDTIREIAVRSTIYTDTSHFTLYRYTGNALVELSQISGANFYDSGQVTTNRHMGFWSLIQQQRWAESKKKFEDVPQEFYPVQGFDTEPIQFETTCDIPVYARRTLKGGSSLIMTAHTRATFMLFAPASGYVDHAGWYFIRNPEGLAGWVHSEQVTSQCFSGLVMAG